MIGFMWPQSIRYYYFNRLQSPDQGDRGLEECDFVAKPIDKQKMFSEESGRLWRKSYSRSEVAKLRKIDQGNQ